jgi:hypothetical protein
VTLRRAESAAARVHPPRAAVVFSHTLTHRSRMSRSFAFVLCFAFSPRRSRRNRGPTAQVIVSNMNDHTANA